MNKDSIKISEEGKRFLRNMKTNRIKADLPELPSFSSCINLIKDYFKNNNKEYVEMLRGNKNE